MTAVNQAETPIKIDTPAADNTVHDSRAEEHALLVQPMRSAGPDVVRTVLRAGIGAVLESMDAVRAGWRLVEPDDAPPAAERAVPETPPDSASDSAPESMRQTLVGALFESVDVTRSLVAAPVRTSLRMGALGIDTARTVAGSGLFAPVRKGTEPVTQLGRGAAAELTRRGKAEEVRSRELFRQTMTRIVDDLAVILTGNPYVTRLVETQVDALLPRLANNAQVQAFVAQQVDVLLPQLADDAQVQAVVQEQVRLALPELAEDAVLQEFIETKIDALLPQLSNDPQLHAFIEAQLDRLLHDLTNDPRIQELIRAQADEYLQYLHDENSEVVQEIVQGQGIDLASDLLNEVRERTVSGDALVEGVVRSILRRPPRDELDPPPKAVRAQAVHLRRSNQPTKGSRSIDPTHESSS